MSTEAKTRRSNGPILRGSRGFVTLKEYGELGDNNKVVMKMSGFNRIVADDARPLASLVIPIMHNLINVCTYKDEATFDEDMATLREYLDRLHFNK